MNKNKENIRDDEMWCPECGAPIKKGFFTCANCKLKVKLTKDLNKKQSKKKKPKISSSKKSVSKKKVAEETKKISKPETKIKEKEELLDDIFEEDTSEVASKKSGTHPSWWSYG